MCVCIYIYIKRERERERDRYTYMYMQGPGWRRAAAGRAAGPRGARPLSAE